MIKTSKQLKDLIRNMAKDTAADAQLLLRNYMMERFLERISLSKYKDSFILKGGMLIAAMVGLDVRSTMDIDATIKGTTTNIETITRVISEIIDFPIDDGVSFQIKSISEIMNEADYPGIRINLLCLFDGTRTPLKIDISTGDIITPREVCYSFNLMFESRSIELWAYNLETVIAEKLETVISRATTNTRMRDYYDLHILFELYGNRIDTTTLQHALAATAKKRESLPLMDDAERVLSEINSSPELQTLWNNYCGKFSYASEIQWATINHSVRKMCIAAGLPIRKPSITQQIREYTNSTEKNPTQRRKKDIER